MSLVLHRNPIAPESLAASALGMPPIAGYQRLATRVIHRALLDLNSSSQSERETARRFLAGSPMLLFWCQLAQVNAGTVLAHTPAEWRETSKRFLPTTGRER